MFPRLQRESAVSQGTGPYQGSISRDSLFEGFRNMEWDPNTPHVDRRQWRPRRVSFEIRTDPGQGDKATEIRLFSFQRPHMRAFHFAWLSFFIAFFGWFSIPPLMPTIKEHLGLTDGQVDNLNIVAVAGTIVGRLTIGPVCDRYGSRAVQAVLLVAGAMPVASAALATNYSGLMVVRFFIGLVGCSFVPTTYWTSTMFSMEVVGSANAIAAGWGNLGAGATYLVTPLLFNLVTINDAVSDNYGWRITLVLPAVLMVIVGVWLYVASDDCPRGNYADLKRGEVDEDNVDVGSQTKLRGGLLEVVKLPVTWLLALQYACCFGVELQVHNVLSLHFYDDFVVEGCDIATDDNGCHQLSKTNASLVSSCFGLMCIFARAVGGYASDVANFHFQMKGRIMVQFFGFAGQALFLFLFSQMTTVAWSIPCLVIFGVFVQACTGSTFGIVPYVCPEYTGVASGIVGAGGNLGGLCWAFLFKGVGNRYIAFEYLSYIVAGAAVASSAIRVKDERTLWCHSDNIYSRQRRERATRRRRRLN
ncbi:hypothetical protein BBJ28_00019007 [Nothophytophthora sp. Chile5]|nr:hypothetical protein BBJ28_00019007 [Nothophytophthora sp. Chile5]